MQTLPLISFIIPIITGIVGYFISLAVERYKSRNVLLKQNIIYNPLGTSTNDPYWGEIKILHNGRITNHINLITVDLENDSTKNFTNMIVDVWTEKNNQILATKANFVGTGVAVPFESNYGRSFAVFLEELDNDAIELAKNPQHQTPDKLSKQLPYFQENKKFLLLAFNRSTSIRFLFLVENFMGQLPRLHLEILHEGVKVIEKEDHETKRRRDLRGMLIWGLIVYAIGLSVLFLHYGNNYTVLILSGILGVTYGLIGLTIHRTIKLMKRIFS